MIGILGDPFAVFPNRKSRQTALLVVVSKLSFYVQSNKSQNMVVRFGQVIADFDFADSCI